MTLSFAGATLELCAFALGLAVTHAVRDHSRVVTKILIFIAAALAAALLLVATLVLAPISSVSHYATSIYEHF